MQRHSMKKYLISCFQILFIIFNFKSFAAQDANVCNCLNSLKGYNEHYRNAWIGPRPVNSRDYPYYLQTVSLKSRKIQDPSKYFEYYHNLQIFNESLVNYLNYIINERKAWPESYPDKKMEKIQNSHLDALDSNDKVDQSLRKRARMVYEECYRLKHRNPTVFYDNCFLDFLEGNVDHSAELAEKYIAACKENNIDYEEDPGKLLQLGQAHIEMAQYFKAIEVLSDIIKKDPTNKEAHFHRSTAYFETGNFDDAISDFISSNNGKEIVKSNMTASNDFIQALIASANQGASESAVEFVPSLCGSVYGLSKTLWTTHWSTNPLNPQCWENIKDFANASYEIGESIVNYCKNVDTETLNGYVDQMKILYERYDQLSDHEKGELIGYSIGRYGVDILAGAVTGTVVGKGVQKINKIVPLFRNLRNANRICNFETMLLSETEKKAILSSSLAHATEREAYFKNIKIHWDKQNKHIPGSHNFVQGGGIIEIETSKLEFLIKNHAGTGQKVLGELLESGYRERVDFGICIGKYAHKTTGESIKYTPTSKGIIVYAKDGKVHVWPSAPDSIIK